MTSPTTNQPTTTYHPVCPQWYSLFDVPSSDGPRSYMVITNGPGGMHFCTCLAFRYSGGYGEQHCKHIDAVITWGCFWQKDMAIQTECLNDRGIYVISSAKNVTTEVCPGCGEPMISTGKAQ